MRNTRKFDQLLYVSEFGVACHDGRRTLVITVIEDAADANVVIRLLFKCADQGFGIGSTADDDSAPLHNTIPCPTTDSP